MSEGSLSTNPFRGLSSVDVDWGASTLTTLAKKCDRLTWLKAQSVDVSGLYACVVAHMAHMKAISLSRAIDNPTEAAFGWVNKDPDLAWIYLKLSAAAIDSNEIPLRLMESYAANGGPSGFIKNSSAACVSMSLF